MKQFLFLFLLSGILPVLGQAQNVAISNSGGSPHPNAMLDIQGVNKGLLVPRGNLATRNLLNDNTAKGLLLYDTSTASFWVHNGNGLASGWQSLAGGTNYWQPAIGNTIRNSNTAGFWSSNSNFIDAAEDPGLLPLPVSGIGTRLMWIAPKSAFRAGSVAASQWDPANVGTWSFAAGYNTIAQGALAVAFGKETSASGLGAFASGSYSSAAGVNSFASGSSRASGDFSTAFGTGTTARAYASVALGYYNDSISSASSSSGQPTDPLVYVGNGTESLRHNTLVIYKNGINIWKHSSTVSGNPFSYTIPVTGEGTRMMWLPGKSAFRVGTLRYTGIFGENDADFWNADQVGLYSFAAGISPKASGISSVSMGSGTYASGSSAVALGNYNLASGISSIAMGDFTTSSGFASTAMGYRSTASGDYAVAGGRETKAQGNYSVAFGQETVASGSLTTTLGQYTRATGSFSTATGRSTIAAGAGATTLGELSVATGNAATAIGYFTFARSFASLVIGRYNDSISSASPTSWVSTDPLLILGNGTSHNSRSNAMVVYKNGDADLNGYTRLGKAAESAPAIKMKRFVIYTPATQGSFNLLAHGLSDAKILSVSGLITVPGGYQFLPNHIQAGHQYTLNVDNGRIAIGTVLGNSANVLNMPVKVLIIYEE